MMRHTSEGTTATISRRGFLKLGFAGIAGLLLLLSACVPGGDDDDDDDD